MQLKVRARRGRGRGRGGVVVHCPCTVRVPNLNVGSRPRVAAAVGNPDALALVIAYTSATSSMSLGDADLALNVQYKLRCRRNMKLHKPPPKAPLRMKTYVDRFYDMVFAKVRTVATIARSRRPGTCGGCRAVVCPQLTPRAEATASLPACRPATRLASTAAVRVACARGASRPTLARCSPWATGSTPTSSKAPGGHAAQR